MARFAMLDLASGFVWGVENAADPVAACRQMDSALGETRREYEEHGPRSAAASDGRSGYMVHEAPAGFDVQDGQDAGQIAAVSALPCVAVVLYTSRDGA